MTEQKKMAKIVYEALDEKKGYDIKLIDISEITMIADYFVIASGDSTTQIQAMINNDLERIWSDGKVLQADSL